MPLTRGFSTIVLSRSRALAVAAAGFLGAVLLVGGSAFAQDPLTGLLAPGHAAVTGFSGTIRPIIVPGEGAESIAKIRIDPNGPALRIIDLHAIGGRPTGQFINEPKPFTFTAGQIGQVFAVTLDNAVPPNIYTAATSAYGLPIAAKGADGKLNHVVKGEPGAAFMPALWGPKATGGGPGSIWRIDGVTGAVSLFANTTFNGAANPGAALGGMVYDPDGDTLLVADRWSGLIHRFRMDGRELATYDHGMDGRAVQGLAPVASAAAPLDVANPVFDSSDASTYGYAAPERRVFGLGIRGGRLYYAIAAGLEIWSVGLNPDGPFGKDAHREIVVPPGSKATEISKITFDDQGRMILAERAPPTGTADFEALTPEGTGRVLRYTIVRQGENGMPVWQPIPDDYAIGFPRDLRNGNGGVAIGYDYDQLGIADRGVCGGFVWSTGEVLRHSGDPDLATRLAASGPLDVSGLQGNWIWLVRPRNVPPSHSVFTDYNDHFDDAAARGHMGDLAIWRVCGPVLRGGWMYPGWISPDVFAGFGGLGGLGSVPPVGRQSKPPSSEPPSLECPADQKKPGFHCCPKGTSPDAAGQCKPWCPSGSTKLQDQFFCGFGFDPAAPSNAPKCLGGSDPVAGMGILGCAASSPIFAAPVCPAGFAKQPVPGLGTLCLQTKSQMQCASGQQIGLDGQCHQLCSGGMAWPITQCCPADAVISVTGQCCPAGSNPDPNTGACQKPTTTPKPTPTPTPNVPSTTPNPGQNTPPSSTPNVPSTTPNPGQDTPPSSTPNGPSSTPNPVPNTTPIPTGPSSTPNEPSTSPNTGQGTTTMPSLETCDTSRTYVDATGQQQCCAQALGPKGQCCPTGYGASGDGACCITSHLTSTGLCCPSGQIPGGPANGQCVPSTPTAQSTPPGGQCCANGSIPTASGMCCPVGQATAIGTCCPAGQKPDARGMCQKTPSPQPTTVTPLIQECSAGQTDLDGTCCPTASVYTDASGERQCCPQPLLANGRCVDVRNRPKCGPGSAVLADGSCCPADRVGRDGRTCMGTTSTPTIVITPPAATCPDGRAPDARGNCRPQGGPILCPDGRAPDARGRCLTATTPTTTQPTTTMPMIQLPPANTCPDGKASDARGNCDAPPRSFCPDGKAPDARGNCPPTRVIPPTCPDGQPPTKDGVCVGRPQTHCPPGQVPNGAGVCVAVPSHPVCSDGSTPDRYGRCAIKPRPNQPTTERPSQTKLTGQTNNVRRPNRVTGSPTHSNLQGVEPQIRKPTVTPPRIVGSKLSKPRPVLLPKQPVKRCINGRCT